MKHSEANSGTPVDESPIPAAGERPIWLVGMMGVGKSTIGPMLARELGRPFIDTDQEIEGRAGRRISEIFEREGEVEFRALERESIERAGRSNAVVALGGGAIAQPGAPERLRELGTVVYLEATPEQLARRLSHSNSRPLLAGLDAAERCDRLRVLLEQRGSSYRRAHLVFDTGAVATEQLARELVAALRQEGCIE